MVSFQEAYSLPDLMHALVNERVYLVMSFSYVHERSEHYFMHAKPNIGELYLQSAFFYSFFVVGGCLQSLKSL